MIDLPRERKIPVEKTTRYATSVDSLAEAWAFVMDKIDEVGPDPTVMIKPLWIVSWSEDDTETPTPRQFEVMVEGMVDE